MDEAAQDAARTDAGFVRKVLIVVGITALVGLLGMVLVLEFHTLLLIFTGAIIAVFLNRLSSLVARLTRLPYGAALAVVLLLALALATAGLVYVIPGIARQAGELSAQLGTAWGRLVDWLDQFEWFRELRGRVPGQLFSASGRVLLTVSSAFSKGFGTVTSLVVILIVGIYGAADPGSYHRGFLRLVPGPRRARADEVLCAVGDTLWWWVLGRLFAMAVIGVATSLGLWLFGVPLAIALGTLAGLLTFIPNIGPILALLPPLLLAFERGPWTALYVTIFYVALQFLESYLLTPMIQQRQILLPPGVTIGAQVLLGVAAGLIGLMVAVPLVAAITVMVKMIYVHGILGDRDDESPAACRQPEPLPDLPP